ncbi:MAG: hypothetical protein HYS13_04925 [Planctomycetia bacterium]|nr:hypothetical protein [Planctomycetia bacterium]
MRAMLAVILFVALTAVSWGVWGPAVHKGGHEMAESRLRPYICVGLAYFGIAVVVPGILMYKKPEQGRWTRNGIIYSFAAGALGALGALGLILAFSFGGRPIYVMPLVFGCAPVVNTFLTMFLQKTYKEAGPVFYAGLILVALGAVGVLVFKPPPAVVATKTPLNVVMVAFSIILTAMSWGTYGPILHKGQAAMGGSRLRPFFCVGMAYLFVSVVAPIFLMGVLNDPGQWTIRGTVWSLAGGAAGAVGALGIILAFQFGGKPVYVMPLVFGGAPVVSTFATLVGDTIATGRVPALHGLFYAGLVVVAVGAVSVLVFAPKPSKHGGASHSSEAKEEPAEAAV